MAPKRTNREATVGEPRLLYTVDEAARLLSLSRSQVYRLMGGGLLPWVNVGKVRRVPRDSLEGFVASLERQ